MSQEASSSSPNRVKQQASCFLLNRVHRPQNAPLQWQYKCIWLLWTVCYFSSVVTVEFMLVCNNVCMTQGPINGYPLCGWERWKFNSSNWRLCNALELRSSKYSHVLASVYGILSIWMDIWRSGLCYRSGWKKCWKKNVLTLLSTTMILFDKLESKGKKKKYTICHTQVNRRHSNVILYLKYFD